MNCDQLAFYNTPLQKLVRNLPSGCGFFLCIGFDQGKFFHFKPQALIHFLCWLFMLIQK